MESNSRAEHSNAKHDSVWATVWWQNAAFSFCYANDTAVSVAQEGGEVAEAISQVYQRWRFRFGAE
jgi:hypothetical protein